jgi:hypothetical protein
MSAEIPPEPLSESTSEPPPEPTSDDPETHAEVLGRIKRTAWVAAAVFAVFAAIFGGFRGFLGLTCSATVTMICFLWLEEIVHVLLQPEAHLHARRLIVRTLARFALLGVSAVTIIIVRFNAVGVLLGFSVIVVGICGEALYSLYRSFTE